MEFQKADVFYLVVVVMLSLAIGMIWAWLDGYNLGRNDYTGLLIKNFTMQNPQCFGMFPNSTWPPEDRGYPNFLTTTISEK